MKNELTNPVKKYLTWKGASDAGNFVYYDKEEAENKVFDLKEFAILSVGYTVKGWSDSANRPIYSNTIENFSEDLRVATSEGQLFKGRYNKAEIEALGGKLHISLTVLTNGEIVNFALKGMAYFNFGKILDSNNWSNARFDLTKSKTVKFTGTEDKKNGAVKYKLPIFEVGDTQLGEKAVKAKESLVKYAKDRDEAYEESKNGGDVDEIEIDYETDVKSEELPF